MVTSFFFYFSEASSKMRHDTKVSSSSSDSFQMCVRLVPTKLNPMRDMMGLRAGSLKGLLSAYECLLVP